MSLFKKQRLEQLPAYHIEEVLKFVGEMSHCKRVSKTFVPVNYTTCVKFKSDTPVTAMFTVLLRRKNLEKLDFTSSTTMNESILHVVLMMHPDVKLIVLDRCDNFLDFLSPCYTEEINFINLTTHSLMK